jgi:hypothetical protein
MGEERLQPNAECCALADTNQVSDARNKVLSLIKEVLSGSPGPELERHFSDILLTHNNTKYILQAAVATKGIISCYGWMMARITTYNSFPFFFLFF